MRIENDTINVKGKDYRLYPLDLGDVVDLERHIGSIEGLEQVNRVQDLVYILWLSMRKNGLSEEQIDRQEWKITERQVARMFNIGNIEKLVPVVNRIFIISGIKEDDLKNAPQPASIKAG